MTAQFLGLVQALQLKVAELNQFYEHKLPRHIFCTRKINFFLLHILPKFFFENCLSRFYLCIFQDNVFFSINFGDKKARKHRKLSAVGEQTRNLITFPPVEYLKIQGR
jgi:hypothetical protein